jgi:hypothetical protein
MLLTFGYDLKDGDRILEAPVQITEMFSPLVQPGGALVNDFPFCESSSFISPMVVMPDSCIQ